MVRVDSRPTRPRSLGPASMRHHAQLTNTIKRPYKVVMEEVTQQKKSLITVEHHNLDPPEGYIFIAAGDPELTAQCKEFARLQGSTVYVVSTSGPRGNELSQQVHRVGYHFPSDIVQRACVMLDIDLDKLDDFLRRHEEWPEERPRRANLSRSKRVKKSGVQKKMVDLTKMSQADLDNQAKSAILDMFPAIPIENLYEIIDHAFEIGSDRVGVQVSELSLPRRAQLAVVAHIRHTYTEYDELLKEMSWSDARKQVAPKTLEKLALWRGDKDDEPDTMEDILREVVIISDDESDDDNDDDDDDEELGVPETPKVTEPPAQADRTVWKFTRLSEPLQYHQGTTAHADTMQVDAAQEQTFAKQDHHTRPPVHGPRRNERYEVWEQTRGRVKTAIHPGALQAKPIPGSREILHAQPPPAKRVEDFRSPVVYAKVPQERNNSRFWVEKRPGDYQSYNHEKEASPRPHDPPNTSVRRNSPPTTINEVQYIEPQMSNESSQALPQSTIIGPARNAVHRRAPPPKELSSLRNPDRPNSASDIIVPSIESPWATRHQDLHMPHKIGDAIEIDSPTHEKQVHYQLLPLAEPRVRPGSSSLKRRRLEGPSDGLDDAGQRFIYKAVDPKISTSRSQVFAPPSTREAKDQGKIVYLPIREDTNSSIFSKPVGALHSRDMFQSNEHSPHDLSYKASDFHHPAVIFSDRTLSENQQLSPRHLANKSLEVPKQQFHNSRQNATLSAYRTFGDHSTRQVYMTERPVNENALPRREAVNHHREILAENSDGQRQGQASWSERRRRRDLPLDQPFVPGSTTPFAESKIQRELPRTDGALGRTQQLTHRDDLSAQSRPNLTSLYEFEYPKAHSILPRDGIVLDRTQADLSQGQQYTGRFEVFKAAEERYTAAGHTMHPEYSRRNVEQSVPSHGTPRHRHSSSVIMLD